MAEQGAKIVAVADHTGGVAKETGLDVPALIAWVSENGGVKGFPDADAFESSEIITWQADVLIPAALEAAIHKDNAAEVKACIIVEGANAPTTPEADAILNERGVLIIPDILANAGGVTASYFEWVQNVQQFKWDEEKVNQELDKKMSRAFRSVHEEAVIPQDRHENGRLRPGHPARRQGRSRTDSPQERTPLLSHHHHQERQSL